MNCKNKPSAIRVSLTEANSSELLIFKLSLVWSSPSLCARILSRHPANSSSLDLRKPSRCDRMLSLHPANSSFFWAHNSSLWALRISVERVRKSSNDSILNSGNTVAIQWQHVGKTLRLMDYQLKLSLIISLFS